MKISENSVLKTTPYVSYLKTYEKSYAVWNRFAPWVVFVNKDTLEFLDEMKNNSLPYSQFKGQKYAVRHLFQNEILVNNDKFDYQKDFIEKCNKSLDMIRKQFNNHINDKLPYKFLNIVTDRCNLNCSYCILKYNGTHNRILNRSCSIKNRKFIFKVIDQFLDRNKCNMKQSIHFNGGEILGCVKQFL